MVEENRNQRSETLEDKLLHIKWAKKYFGFGSLQAWKMLRFNEKENAQPTYILTPDIVENPERFVSGDDAYERFVDRLYAESGSLMHGNWLIPDKKMREMGYTPFHRHPMYNKVFRLYLSIYDRAVIDNTLYRFDVERNIAFIFLLFRTPAEAVVEDIIKSELECLRRNLQSNAIAPVYDVEDDEEWFWEPALKERRLLMQGKMKVTDCKYWKARTDFIKSSEIIYQLMNGNASEQDEYDYYIQRDRYLMRAIQSNEKWLIQALTKYLNGEEEQFRND